MLEGTKLHRAPEEPSTGSTDPAAKAAADPGEAEAVASPVAASSAPRVVFDQDGLTVIEAAVKVQKAGRAAVGVNAASAYSVGGGVLSGGRHALEESCCITSTLLASLQKAQWDQLHSPEEKPASRGQWRDDEGPHAHVPVDGCIVSPAVEVFRDPSTYGYGFFEAPVRLQGFCSVAMFNMNPRVSDSPLDAPRDFKAYCLQVKQKFRAVVTGAVHLGAEVLVCPDVGCGVFGNDPQILGTMLGEVLREAPPPNTQPLAEVLLTGQVAFAEAVKKAAAGEKVDLKPPAYFASAYGAVDGYMPYGKERPARDRSKGGRPDRHNPTVVVATVVNPVQGPRAGNPQSGATATALPAQPVAKAAAQPGPAPSTGPPAHQVVGGVGAVGTTSASEPSVAVTPSVVGGATPLTPGQVPATGGSVM